MRYICPGVLAGLVSGAACAQTPVANASAEGTQASVSLNDPEMLGLLSFTPGATRLDAGPFGTWYVDGVASGLGLGQTEAAPSDRTALADIGNGEIILQKTGGTLQFYVQAGAYAIPTLGTPYTHTTSASTELADLYGPVPQAFVKLAPSQNFNVVAGKLPSLLGAEDNFTFQNNNISRGLLWSQETAISRGVQVNLTVKSVTFAMSLNDGFYSNRYTWLTGSATWAIDTNHSLVFAAGGNLGRTAANTLATPLAQNNGSIYNLIAVVVVKPFTITPYLQYTTVARDAALGIHTAAASYGAAVLGSATIGEHYGIAARLEYLGTNGRGSAAGATNLLYGPDSSAVSVTVTPTFILKHVFARADVACALLVHSTPGDGFGGDRGGQVQWRGLLEAGVVF